MLIKFLIQRSYQKFLRKLRIEQDIQTQDYYIRNIIVLIEYMELDDGDIGALPTNQIEDIYQFLSQIGKYVMVLLKLYIFPLASFQMLIFIMFLWIVWQLIGLAALQLRNLWHHCKNKMQQGYRTLKHKKTQQAKIQDKQDQKPDQKPTGNGKRMQQQLSIKIQLDSDSKKKGKVPQQESTSRSSISSLIDGKSGALLFILIFVLFCNFGADPNTFLAIKQLSKSTLKYIFIVIFLIISFFIGVSSVYREKVCEFHHLIGVSKQIHSRQKSVGQLHYFTLMIIGVILEIFSPKCFSIIKIYVKAAEILWLLCIIYYVFFNNRKKEEKEERHTKFYIGFTLFMVAPLLLYFYSEPIHNFLLACKLPDYDQLENVLVLCEVILFFLYLYGIAYGDLIQRSHLDFIDFFMIQKLVFFIKVSPFFLLFALIYTPFIIELQEGFLISKNINMKKYYKAFRQVMKEIYKLLTCILILVIFIEYYNSYIMKTIFIVLMLPLITQIYQRFTIEENILNYFNKIKKEKHKPSKLLKGYQFYFFQLFAVAAVFFIHHNIAMRFY